MLVCRKCQGLLLPFIQTTLMHIRLKTNREFKLIKIIKKNLQIMYIQHGCRLIALNEHFNFHRETPLVETLCLLDSQQIGKQRVQAHQAALTCNKPCIQFM